VTDTTPPSAEEQDKRLMIAQASAQAAINCAIFAEEAEHVADIRMKVHAWVAEAERAGRRRGLEEAAAVADDYERGENASSEIRALIDDEPGNE